MNPPEHRDHAPPPRVNQSSVRSFLFTRTKQATGAGSRQPDDPPTLQAFLPPRRGGRFPLWERLTEFFRKMTPHQPEPDTAATRPIQATPARDISSPQNGDAIPTLSRANPGNQSRQRALLIAGGLIIALVVAVAMILWTHASASSKHLITLPQSPTGTAAALYEFGGLTANGGPHSIIMGSDNDMWFVERDANKIGERVTISGKLREYPIPTPASRPLAITAGPDGNLWFTEGNASKIGRITTSGHVTEFGGLTRKSYPLWITTGPDGNLWFTERDANKIGRISPKTGAIAEFPVPTPNSKPGDITIGPDKNMWFTEQAGNLIGRITPNGQITEFGGMAQGSFPAFITSGPHEALWFTEQSGNRIGRLDTNGHLHEFRLPANSKPGGITTGPDGNLWFTEQNSNFIEKMASSGTILAGYAVPTGGSDPFDITTGPNGSIWFVEVTGDKVGQIVLAG